MSLASRPADPEAGRIAAARVHAGTQAGSNKDAPRSVACILGVPIDSVDMRRVVGQISAAAASRRPLFISTVNLNFLALSQRSRQFRKSLWASELCTADGVGIILVCRLLGIRVPERVAGSDFLAAVAKSKDLSLGRPLRVFFFGGAEDAGGGACEAVNAIGSPHLHCEGSLYPGFGSIEDMSQPETIAAINAARADFLIVSLGAEKGQSWIMRNREAITAPVVSHLGATINFLSGSVRRAPPRIQSLGLEWLWRIREERHLAARYARDAVSLLGLIATRILPLRAWLTWSGWRWRDEVLAACVQNEAAGRVRVSLKGAATLSDLGTLNAALQWGLDAAEVTIDLRELRWLDLFAMGSLMSARMASAERGVNLSVVNVAPGLRRALALAGFGPLSTSETTGAALGT